MSQEYAGLPPLHAMQGQRTVPRRCDSTKERRHNSNAGGSTKILDIPDTFEDAGSAQLVIRNCYGAITRCENVIDSVQRLHPELCTSAKDVDGLRRTILEGYQQNIDLLKAVINLAGMLAKDKNG